MTTLKEKILNTVETDLKHIETALVENLTPHTKMVKDVASHILFSGGKRLRPLLMILCAKLCGYDKSDKYTLSTMFEYLHAATLLHDDLIDEADQRRGQKVAHKVWDNPTAVLTGDFLLARGLMIAASTNHPDVIRIIANITSEMSQGEILQLHRKGALDLTETEYLKIIRCKTAVLFEGACAVSGMISKSPQHVIKALTDFGFHLGLAFQMADDLLDYNASFDSLGKEIGADLKEGKLTLPLIHTLESAETSDHRFIEETIHNQTFDEKTFKRLISIINTYEGMEYTKNKASRHVQNAKDALSIFKESDEKNILFHIADYALSRDQ